MVKGTPGVQLQQQWHLLLASILLKPQICPVLISLYFSEISPLATLSLKQSFTLASVTLLFLDLFFFF